MTRFTSTPMPYTTRCNQGDEYTVIARYGDDKIVAVTSTTDGSPYAEVFHDDGTHCSPYADHSLLEPECPHRAAYNRLDPNVRELMTSTIVSNRKIIGIKCMRGLLGLGLLEAKTLWESLADEHTRRC